MNKSIYNVSSGEKPIRLFTISILVENKPGVLNNITIIFTRRRLNIDSISCNTPKGTDNGHITVELYSTEEQIIKVVKQIEKIIEVINATFYEQDQLYHHEVALYKIPLKSFYNNGQIENITFNSNAKILAIEEEYVVIEKSGTEEEITTLFHRFKEFGLLEFVRSGRIAISKSAKKRTSFFRELEESEYQLVN